MALVWSRMLRWAFVALVAMLTLEICARLDDSLSHGAPLLRNYTIDSIFQFTPAGKKGIPNARYRKWELNSLGYRGEEPAPDRPSVLVIGASESFGISEPAGMEYPAQLRTALQRRSLSVNVVNAAVPGMRHGYIEYVRDALTTVDPDYVLIYPSPANYIGRTQPLCTVQRSWVRHSDGWQFPQSRVVSRIWDAFKATAPVPILEVVRRFQIVIASKGPALDRVPDATIQSYGEDLACVIREVRARGAIPLLLGHATIFGHRLSAHDRLEMLAWRTFYPNLTGAGFADLEIRANEAAEEVATREGIPYADLSKILEPGHGNFSDFVHFTERGASIVAEAAAELVLAARRGR